MKTSASKKKKREQGKYEEDSITIGNNVKRNSNEQMRENTIEAV